MVLIRKIRCFGMWKSYSYLKAKSKKGIRPLFNRANLNGAKVEFIEKRFVEAFIKYIYCATDQALWSPNTCVVDPKAVLKRLCKRVEEMGVEIIYDSKIKNINTRERTLKIFFIRNF